MPRMRVSAVSTVPLTKGSMDVSKISPTQYFSNRSSALEAPLSISDEVYVCVSV